MESEFIRVFKTAIAENKAEELFPVLDNISVENIDSLKSDEIRKILSMELENKSLYVKFNTMLYLQYWIDNDILLKNQHLLSKLKKKLKDENWKIRWHANRILTFNNIKVEKISFLDAIRAKISKPYSI